MDDVYWVMRRDQVEALAAPLRQEICDRLAAFGPLSVHDLSEALGRRATAIYHHLKRMEAVGLVRASGSAGERGRPGALYETVAPRMRLARAGEASENRDALARSARAMGAAASGGIAAAYKTGHWTAEGPQRNLWFFRTVAAPSPARLARINALLDELAELMWAPESDPGEPISLAWFLSSAPPGRPTEPRRKPAPSEDP